MPDFAWQKLAARTVLAGIAAAFCTGAVLAADDAKTAEAAAIPNFSSTQYGWIAQGVNFRPSLGAAPHEVANDPNYPFKPPGRGEAPTFRVADLSNPILQPWTREELKKRNERIVSGGTGYTRQVSCWPMGVPAFLLIPAQPVYFIQTPKMVTMVAQMDQQVRRIYMDVPHSAHVTPSWYGESVGRYDGDTLVVDTIGMNDQTWIDNYRTPHSDQLHVVERFRVMNDGKTLEVNVHVEDPGAFTTAWDTVQRYDRADQAWLEFVCAENNLNVGDIDPMPQAKRPDF